MNDITVTCPLCGNQFVIQNSMRECFCTSCGAKLLTAALVKEPAEVSVREEPAEAEAPREDERHDTPVAEAPAASEKHSSVEGINAPELTEEEIAEELERKAKYKAELKHTVKRIDELRARRSVFSSQKDTARVIISVGAVSIAAAAAVLLIFRGSDGGVTLLSGLIGGALGLVGAAMVILGSARMGDIKKQRARLEESIQEHKQKRDVLIGRLNRINKRLHIQHDEHEHEHNDKADEHTGRRHRHK